MTILKHNKLILSEMNLIVSRIIMCERSSVGAYTAVCVRRSHKVTRAPSSILTFLIQDGLKVLRDLSQLRTRVSKPAQFTQKLYGGSIVI